MTSISKNVCIDKLDDIFNKQNNTYHRAIRMKPGDVKPNSHTNPSKEINYTNPKFKIDGIVRISKYKMFPIGLKKFLSLKELQKAVPWTYVINDLDEEEIDGTFYEKRLQKSNQKEFRVEKVIKIKDGKLYVKQKGYDNLLNSWIDKKETVCLSKYFPEEKSSRQRMKVELDLPNYATKADLKTAGGVDTSHSLLKKLIQII